MRHAVLSFCILIASCATALAQKRVALIIANSEYQYLSKLANPTNDAKAVSKLLMSIGFAQNDITVKFDVGYDAMRLAVIAFSRQAASADMALIYFAGHGYGSGVNYLIPVDARLESAGNLPNEAFSQRVLEDAVKPARGLKLVILDACRNDPSQGRMAVGAATRNVSRGLEANEPDGGVLVAYSAKHGTVAQDGPEGGNSPFAVALMRHLNLPGTDIRFVFGGVRDDVLTATRRAQEPFLYGSLGRDPVYLVPPANSPQGQPTSPPVVQAPDAALQAWQAVQSSDSEAVLQEFIRRFGDSIYASFAQAKLEEIRKQAEIRRRQQAAVTPHSVPQTPRFPPTPPTASYHYVWDTRPPDDFLALRTAPGGAGGRIIKMPNGTLLEAITKRSDNWWYVRVVATGQEGWILSQQGSRVWVYCCRTR